MTARPRDPATVRRLALLALVAATSLPLLGAAGLLDGTLFDARSLAAGGRFVGAFWPPAHDPAFLARALEATATTLACATLGLALALLLGTPLALAAAECLSRHRIGRPDARRPALVRVPVRWLLIALRGVPELVWALLLVRLVGLGPSAGVAAIAIAGVGLVGKAFAEIVDAAPRAPSEALLAGGAGRLSAFAFGTLPDAAPELLSYAVYRWECAVRTSAVLGFVGAGGLGQEIDLALRQFDGARVASLIVLLVLLVLAADRTSAALRNALERDVPERAR